MNVVVRLPNGCLDVFKDKIDPIKDEYLKDSDMTVSTRHRIIHFFSVNNGYLEVSSEESTRYTDNGKIAYNTDHIISLVGSYRSNQYLSVREEP